MNTREIIFIIVLSVIMITFHLIPIFLHQTEEQLTTNEINEGSQNAITHIFEQMNNWLSTDEKEEITLDINNTITRNTKNKNPFSNINLITQDLDKSTPQPNRVVPKIGDSVKAYEPPDTLKRLFVETLPPDHIFFLIRLPETFPDSPSAKNAGGESQFNYCVSKEGEVRSVTEMWFVFFHSNNVVFRSGEKYYLSEENSIVSFLDTEKFSVSRLGLVDFDEKNQMIGIVYLFEKNCNPQ